MPSKLGGFEPCLASKVIKASPKTDYPPKFFKGATKLYFTCYSCVVIILFNKGLYKSAFCTYSFEKLVFCLSTKTVFSTCSEFDEIFINFYDICLVIIYIEGNLYRRKFDQNS